MGCPRWEMAGNEMGRRRFHMTWDFQDGKWQVMTWEDEFATDRRWDVQDGKRQGNEMGRRIYHRRWGRPRWEVAEMGRRIYHNEMGRPRWEVAGHEMGRRIYHRRWDVQDRKWQVMRWEDEFTT